MQALDPRIVRVSIEVDGAAKIYEKITIYASGTKYANANQNDAEVKLYNLDNETLDYILTETSPFNLNKTPKILYIDAGRESYGVTRIFKGNIVTATPSQPPDIAVTLKCLTANYQKGQIVAKTQSGTSSLSQISSEIASDLGLSLDFQAKDKNIGNYNYTGGALKQVDELNKLSTVSAYVDDDKLVVKEINLPLSNVLTIVNQDTGMVGIPEITEQGLKVKILLDGRTELGGAMEVTSKIYPAVNGQYVIYKLGFEIANRDIPFYWIAEGKRLQ